ncbi:hypothetical protein BCR37DRAFT_381833 [Protomyces lactucae-debilis]|uniref:Uncharacterized protein n=1 Tax=Protomyces lactucae-debilis TaxID=2754530 RepID=A0A1Y2F533_PROLT|nr:uncharacterized protein BCR37DRAFT_381833 [Protomyces lactucae-debilis]ORY78969.1 hypothetical protein BCR37DRAFT_381833 [Protomyces lactucae-debilis]
MSAQAVPTDAALALVASLQTRKQGLADRLHTSLLSVLRTTAAGHVPSITLTRASKEETYFDHATQSVRLRTERQQRVLTFGKKEAFSTSPQARRI